MQSTLRHAHVVQLYGAGPMVVADEADSAAVYAVAVDVCPSDGDPDFGGDLPPVPPVPDGGVA